MVAHQLTPAEQREAGASVGLAFEEFRFVVDAFGSSVAVGQIEAGLHRGPVFVQALDETVQHGQVIGGHGLDPRVEVGGCRVGVPVVGQ